MKDQNKQKRTITSPEGTALYPHLNKADTKFADQGIYSVTLQFPESEAAPFLEKCQAAFDEYLDLEKLKAKKTTLKLAEKPWTTEDGTTSVKIKVRALVPLKNGDTWDRKPLLHSATGGSTDNIGSGSRLKIAVLPFCCPHGSSGHGIQLQPEAVSVVELVEYGNENAEAKYGFEKAEQEAVASSDIPF